jgi:hypothetical protein
VLYQASINALQVAFIFAPAAALDYLKSTWIRLVNFQYTAKYSLDQIDTMIKEANEQVMKGLNCNIYYL